MTKHHNNTFTVQLHTPATVVSAEMPFTSAGDAVEYAQSNGCEVSYDDAYSDLTHNQKHIFDEGGYRAVIRMYKLK